MCFRSAFRLVRFLILDASEFWKVGIVFGKKLAVLFAVTMALDFAVQVDIPVCAFSFNEPWAAYVGSGFLSVLA